MQLDRASYFSPCPVLALDAQWRISDFNLALAALLPEALNGSRQTAALDWLKAKTPAYEGQFVPAAIVDLCEAKLRAEELTGDQMMGTGSSRLHATAYGPACLDGTGVCIIDRTTGEFLGAVVSWQITKLERMEAYRARLYQLWRHQLVWELYAVSYDHILPELSFYTEVRDRHVAAMLADGISTVADIGAGTGNVTVPLLKAGRTVTAVDLSRAMLAKLREKVGEPPPPGLTLVEANAEVCPIAPASVDGVSILLALYDMEDPDRAWNEALRILRPGGTIIVTEPKACCDLDFLLKRAAQLLAEKGLARSHREHFQRVFQANREFDPRKKEKRLLAEEVRERLEAARFLELSWKDSHAGNCQTITGKKP